MNLHQMTQSSKVNQLTILHPTVLHVIPEFGYDIGKMIHNSGIRLNNCFAIVSRSDTTKIGSKTFNARKFFLRTKELFMGKSEDFEKKKSIQVLNDFPKSTKEILENKFIIIDHTLITEATNYMLKRLSLKQSTLFLFNQIKEQFTLYKTKYPQLEHNILFTLPGIKSQEISLIDMFKVLEPLAASNNGSVLKVFDKYILVNISNDNLKSITFPIAMFNKGYPKLIRQNIRFINEIYGEIEQYQIDEPKIDTSDTSNTKAISKDLEDIKLNDNHLKKLSKEMLHTVTPKTPIEAKIDKTFDEKTHDFDIDEQRLSKILKKYKVKDKTIENNIRAALDNYLTQTNREVTSENLEKVVLLSINKAIFNTDKIDDIYLTNPEGLFHKLEEVNTYSIDIEYPKLKDNVAVQPNEIIDLKRVSGLVRHKYEFSDNIHSNIKTLFKSLQNKATAPINIKSFKYEYEDNNLNRTINYQITLQNISDEKTEPYTVNVKVPALVNDRYFKLNGKNYILSNQQFFVPITKTEPNECRLLSSYAMITLSVVNLKMNLSEIDKLLEFINIRYNSLIKKLEYDSNNKIKYAILQFKNEEYIIDLYSLNPFIGPKERLISDEDSGKWLIQSKKLNEPWSEKEFESKELGIGKEEYIYTKLKTLIQYLNPNETLQKTQSNAYIQIHISGTKTPLIIYFWQRMGLLTSLTKFNIPYEITSKSPQSNQFISIKLEQDKNLYIYPETERQKLIANGLYLIDFKRYLFTSDSINDKTSIETYINDKNGSRACYNLDLVTTNLIDPITKEILEFQNLPTNVTSLISERMLDVLLNQKADSLADLKLYRSRQAEIIFNILYKELMMAHNNYTNERKINKDAKLFLKEDYVIESLLGVHVHSHGNSVVELSQPFNPISELKTASKTIKTGPNGVPNKRSFKSEHRAIHPSYFGNLG